MSKMFSWAGALCWLTVLLDGFDLVVLAGSAHQWSFYFFAAVACLAGFAMIAVPRIDARADEPANRFATNCSGAARRAG